MEKKKVTKLIFSKIKNTPFKWKDIKHLNFEDDDEIELSYQEAYYGSDSSMDAHYSGRIARCFLETDEEFEKRKQDEEKFKELSQKRRYEQYLKLREEFE